MSCECDFYVRAGEIPELMERVKTKFPSYVFVCSRRIELGQSPLCIAPEPMQKKGVFIRK